ncbi:MAG: DUF1320 family protein [Methylibium sp.]|nr:DUF1320 family protein [Methylibium sp.]
MSQYATQAQFQNLGLRASALEGVPLSIQNQFLDATSGTIDSYLRGRYSLPLAPAAYPPEIVDACLAITAYRVLVWRGFNPEAATDVAFKERHDFYLGSPGQKGWLDKVASGAVSLAITADATPTTHEGGSIVANGSARGWGDDLNGVGEPIGNFWGAPKLD